MIIVPAKAGNPVLLFAVLFLTIFIAFAAAAQVEHYAHANSYDTLRLSNFAPSATTISVTLHSRILTGLDLIEFWPFSYWFKSCQIIDASGSPQGAITPTQALPVQSYLWSNIAMAKWTYSFEIPPEVFSSSQVVFECQFIPPRPITVEFKVSTLDAVSETLWALTGGKSEKGSINFSSLSRVVNSAPFQTILFNDPIALHPGLVFNLESSGTLLVLWSYDNNSSWNVDGTEGSWGLPPSSPHLTFGFVTPVTIAIGIRPLSDITAYAKLSVLIATDPNDFGTLLSVAAPFNTKVLLPPPILDTPFFTATSITNPTTPYTDQPMSDWPTGSVWEYTFIVNIPNVGAIDSVQLQIEPHHLYRGQISFFHCTSISPGLTYTTTGDYGLITVKFPIANDDPVTITCFALFSPILISLDRLQRYFSWDIIPLSLINGWASFDGPISRFDTRMSLITAASPSLPPTSLILESIVASYSNPLGKTSFLFRVGNEPGNPISINRLMGLAFEIGPNRPRFTLLDFMDKCTGTTVGSPLGEVSLYEELDTRLLDYYSDKYQVINYKGNVDNVLLSHFSLFTKLTTTVQIQPDGDIFFIDDDDKINTNFISTDAAVPVVYNGEVIEALAWSEMGFYHTPLITTRTSAPIPCTIPHSAWKQRQRTFIHNGSDFIIPIQFKFPTQAQIGAPIVTNPPLDWLTNLSPGSITLSYRPAVVAPIRLDPLDPNNKSFIQFTFLLPISQPNGQLPQGSIYFDNAKVLILNSDYGLDDLETIENDPAFASLPTPITIDPIDLSQYRPVDPTLPPISPGDGICGMCHVQNTARCDATNTATPCTCKTGFTSPTCSLLTTSTCPDDTNSICAASYVGYVERARDGTCDAATCHCLNEWRGSNCGQCALECSNGGSPYKDCYRCGCRSGFNGNQCQCRSAVGTITLSGGTNAVITATGGKLSSSLSSSSLFTIDDINANIDLSINSPLQPPTTSDDIKLYTLMRVLYSHLMPKLTQTTTSPIGKMSLTINPTSTSPTSSTTFTFTIKYGCADFNSHWTSLDQVTDAWNRFSTVFGNLPTIIEHFGITPTTPITNDLDETPSTLPDPDDEATDIDVKKPNTAAFYPGFWGLSTLTILFSFFIV